MDENMSKPSRVHIKLLGLTLLCLFMLSGFANLVVRYRMADSEFRSVRSGIFTSLRWDITDGYWYASAVEANGNIIFFAYLAQEEINNLKITSSIETGALVLAVVQGESRLEFDISYGAFSFQLSEYETGKFIPGRIQMQLYFVNAVNPVVDARWD